MAEIYKYPKRHQGRFRERRKHILIYRGSAYGLIGRINYLRTLGKT